MSSLQGYVDPTWVATAFSGRVYLLMQDGRSLVGVLSGFDQKSNVVLSDCSERIYSLDEGVEEVPLGIYLLKGDMIVLIGELDAEAEKAVDLSTIRAEQMPPMRY